MYSPSPVPPGPRGEERLEDLRPQLGGYARAVVGELAYYGIAHVACARDDADAAVLLLAMLPGVAHQVPHDLVEMAAIEDDQQLARRLDGDASGRDAFRLRDFVEQRLQEVGEYDDLRLLPVAPVELQHFADDAVDALGVVADHRQQALALGRHRAVLFEQLRGLVDRGQRIAHFVCDARGQPSHGRELDLLRLALGAAQVLEIDQRAAVESRADAHQPHAQQTLRRVDLERRQVLGEVLLPAAPVVVQRRAEFRQAHAAAHAAEAAQQARHLRVVAAHDAVEVDDQHAVLHVLDDEPIDLLEIGDVDAALRGEVLAGLGVAAERERDAYGREVAEADEPGLQDLRGRDLSLDQPPAVEHEQHRARERRVEECDLRAHQPAARGELREQQYGQRPAGAAAGIHQHADEEDVAHEQREQQGGQRQHERVALHPPEGREAETEVEAGGGEERVGRADADRAQVDEQRDAEQQRAADRAIQTDDPQDPPPRFGHHARQRRRLERRRGGCGRHHLLAFSASRTGHPHMRSTPADSDFASARGRNTPQRVQRTIGCAPAASGAAWPLARDLARALRWLTMRSASSTTKINTSQAMILAIRPPCRG